MKPIAVRRLTWNDGDVEREVLVRIWQPVPNERDFVCDFAIDGLREPVRAHAGGVDAIQASPIGTTFRGSTCPARMAFR
jgi:hypothetical protein